VGLAERLGVSEEAVARVPLLQTASLPDPEKLLSAAFEVGASDPPAAQLLLAASMLSQAQRTVEGRLAATLALLARLVARANPAKTLGPEGAAWRAEHMSNGWKYTLGSWVRLRYAWREGMREILDIQPDDLRTAEALDEVTRLTPAEPEPVSVAIQEVFPQPGIGFGVSVLALAVSGWSLHRELSYEKRRKGRG
jgi:hypothetical protein